MKSIHVCMILAFLQEASLAFQPTLPRLPTFTTSETRHGPRPSMTLQAKLSPTGDFELQELKAQIEGMKRQGIASKSLSPTKVYELESYARSVVEKKVTPVPLEQVRERLIGTKWRLAFSTDNASLSSLPGDATVCLDFVNDKTMKYTLQFGKKTAGLNSITAESTWTVDQTNGNRDGSYPGFVSIVYDKITCDAFGLSNLGVGFFGLLKGRAAYIQTVYFDDELWIDGGYAADGSTYFSVYTQEDNL